MQQPTTAQIRKADRVIVLNEDYTDLTWEYLRSTEVGYENELQLAKDGEVLEPDMEGLTAKDMLKCNTVLQLWTGGRMTWECTDLDLDGE